MVDLNFDALDEFQFYNLCYILSQLNKRRNYHSLQTHFTLINYDVCLKQVRRRLHTTYNQIITLACCPYWAFYIPKASLTILSCLQQNVDSKQAISL